MNTTKASVKYTGAVMMNYLFPHCRLTLFWLKLTRSFLFLILMMPRESESRDRITAPGNCTLPKGNDHFANEWNSSVTRSNFYEGRMKNSPEVKKIKPAKNFLLTYNFLPEKQLYRWKQRYGV